MSGTRLILGLFLVMADRVEEGERRKKRTNIINANILVIVCSPEGKDLKLGGGGQIDTTEVRRRSRLRNNGSINEQIYATCLA